jgi:hypothetical protein
MSTILLYPILTAFYLTGCFIAGGIYIGHERNARQLILKVITCLIVTALSWAAVGWALGRIARGL